MTVTIEDVAKAANVSKSTVSQFLNNRFDYMSVNTKQRIASVIEELGYEPNRLARSLKQKNTFTIGVIVANILHTFSTQTIRAIEDHCHGEGYHLIVCNADDDTEKEKQYIHMLRAKQVDGLIIFPTGDNLDLYQKLVDDQYPLVFLDRTVKDIQASTVMLDNEKAMQLAVTHLADQGFERIGLLTPSITHHVSPRVERIEGFKKAMNELGVQLESELIRSVELDQMQSELLQMLSLENPPDALIAGNDLTTIEILTFFKEQKLTIPEDVALAGIDEVAFAQLLTPALTTVAQPTFAMGKKAASLLLDKINNRSKDEQLLHRFEPELMIRESTTKRS